MEKTAEHLQATTNQPAAPSASGLSVLAEEDGHRPPQSSLVRGHHFRAGQEWLLIPGRNHGLDNIFIERLWRSLKQEAIYLEDIHDGFAARRVIKKWMAFYNSDRPHSALDRQTPDDAYLAGIEHLKAA